MLGSIGALLVQSLLIFGLLYERRARRQAESDSRRNLALAADASRRQTMSALTTSIAHELGQPLSSMIHNAEALQTMVAADRATSGHDRRRSCPTSGRRASRPPRSSSATGRCCAVISWRGGRSIFHGVINESLALVAHDLKAREIETAVNLSSSPCVIDGDAGAPPAGAGEPDGERHGRDGRDAAGPAASHDRDATSGRPTSRSRCATTGAGLPPQVDGTLFTPFVTTKPHGLGIGLTIVRTIVDAHGGTIEARNNPDGGATFTVTLRRSELAETRSASASAVDQTPPRPDRGRPPGRGEGRVPAAGARLRGRGNHRRRRRCARGRATTPARRDRGRPEPARPQRAGGVSPDDARRTRESRSSCSPR